MKNRLPVYIDNKELPVDELKMDDGNSYGYVNVLFLVTIITTVASMITIVILIK